MGGKLITNVVLKNIQEWILKTSKIKPKYANLVALENIHYLMDCINRAVKTFPGHVGYLEASVFALRQQFDHHLDLYIEETFGYFVPYLKEGNANDAFKKAFGGKNMGSTFEKIARRVNKHLCKEHFLQNVVMTRVRSVLHKMIEKATKEHKITSVTLEQLDFFINEEGAKIMNKYAKKL